MRENIANCLCIEKDRVNIKATTEEKLGFTGEGLGISSQARCLIESAYNYTTDVADVRGNGGCGGCQGCSGSVR